MAQIRIYWSAATVRIFFIRFTATKHRIGVNTPSYIDGRIKEPVLEKVEVVGDGTQEQEDREPFPGPIQFFPVIFPLAKRQHANNIRAALTFGKQGFDIRARCR